MRVLLGDQQGQVRAEVDEGQLESVIWRLNREGSAWVTIKRNSTAFRQELLEPGARIYAEFDNGLPAWGGVLDLPRMWEAGTLRIRAYTIERLLTYTMTPKTQPFYSTTVGQIFNTILMEADTRAALGITIGQVWHGGQIHDPRYHFRDAMWVINQSIRKMEVCDYRFIPYLSSGRIRFSAELHERLGDDNRTRVMLAEGANVAAATLTEQGDIVNRVAVVGTGATWAERQVVYGVEQESQRRYGLREKAIVPPDVSQTTTLMRHADRAIREDAYPHRLADMSVADRPPSRFVDYEVGDIVRVQLVSYGFEGYDAPMRVTARGYNPLTGECQLVCDERFEYTPVIQSEDESQLGGDDAGA